MTQDTDKVLHILGIRGIPGAHGGFETFAQHLAPWLVERGWKVIVYCQHEGDRNQWEDQWNGVDLVHISVPQKGAFGTVVFDALSIAHAAKQPGKILTLGYNTALFNLYLRLKGRRIAMNMDGIEWKRAKWSLPYKAWFYLNELAGCFIAQRLVADHPRIEDHLARLVKRDKIKMIPYGANDIEDVPSAPIDRWGLSSRSYFISICRIEPENSILEIVRAFTQADYGDKKLVILGKFEDTNPYHCAVKAAANTNVVFPGAIYEAEIVQALRAHALAYCHGHTVGGTNPSLVEALGVGCAVLAHDNKYNKWVAGENQFYFSDIASCTQIMSDLCQHPAKAEAARTASKQVFKTCFTWPVILEAYQEMLLEL